MGFRREFSKWDPEGWKSMYPELAGVPFCAVDVIPDTEDAPVNGVTFSVDADYLPALKRREIGYKLLKTPAFDFETGKSLGECFVFSSNLRDGTYAFEEPAQERYTKLCLDAAREHGEDFYRQFLRTTYIDGKPLDMLPQFNNDQWQHLQFSKIKQRVAGVAKSAQAPFAILRKFS